MDFDCIPDIKYNDFKIDIIGGDCSISLSNMNVTKWAPAEWPASWIDLNKKFKPIFILKATLSEWLSKARKGLFVYQQNKHTSVGY